MNLVKYEGLVSLGIRARNKDLVPPPTFPFILVQFSILIKSLLIMVQQALKK